MATHSETRAALVASVGHWRRNEAVLHIKDAKIGAMYCALCALFQSPRDGDFICHGCPVSAHTGKETCAGSPYGMAARSCYDVKDCNAPLSAFTAAARIEREFLEMLLEKMDRETAAEAPLVDAEEGDA